MNNKSFMLVSIFIVSMFLGMITSYANCSDCVPGKCSDCGCIENETKTACVYANYSSSIVSCGEVSQGKVLIDKIPPIVPKIISMVYVIIQVAVPVVLVIFGSLDLFKSISQQKEDEIKKGQKIFIKRIISAVLVFFVFVIVKFVISLAADNSGSAILECVECFIENKCITE